MDLSFLPQLPFVLSAPIMFGALLAAGLLAGEAVNRYASLPRITGYALAGVALGPQLSGVLSDEVLHALSVLVDLSVGLIVFELGIPLRLGVAQAQPLAAGDGGRRKPVRVRSDIRRAVPTSASSRFWRRAPRRSAPRHRRRW